MIALFRGRRLDAGRPVDVYRNLRAGGYSLRQGGRVVAHADAIMLADVRFVVSRAGWARSRQLGKKTVHAIARGRVVDSGMGTTAEEASKLPRIRYDLETGRFLTDLCRPPAEVRGAAVVAFNARGAFGAYFTRGRKVDAVRQ